MKNIHLAAILLLSAIISLTSFTSSGKGLKRPELKGTINITGTRFLFPLVEKWAAEFKKENPGVDFVIRQGVPDIDIEASAAPVKSRSVERKLYRCKPLCISADS